MGCSSARTHAQVAEADVRCFHMQMLPLNPSIATALLLVFAVGASAQPSAPRAPSPKGPDHVDITWMSISNMHYDLGPLQIVTDGYITRLPQSAFSGGGGGLASTSTAFTPDVSAVRRVLGALGGPTRVNVLLTGHSHFDHSFDTGTWATLTGAPIIGSKTTCLQVRAERVPAERCTAVYGGEVKQLADGVTMYIIRWNHSGDPATNPEQHNPVELNEPPHPDPVTGGLRAGVAEDFPNGGGNRAFLFVVDGAGGRFSWFYQNSASVIDINVPIVVDGVDYGAPLENLKRALREAQLTSVDLWIGTGGSAIASVLLPVLTPKAYLPVHWDSFWTPFTTGTAAPFANTILEPMLSQLKIQLVRPSQYMDKWRLDHTGVTRISNTAVQQSLGLPIR